MDPRPEQYIEEKTGNEQVDAYCAELRHSLDKVLPEYKKTVEEMIETVKKIYKAPELLETTKLTARARKILYDALTAEGRLADEPKTPDSVGLFKQITSLRQVKDWEGLFSLIDYLRSSGSAVTPQEMEDRAMLRTISTPLDETEHIIKAVEDGTQSLEEANLTPVVKALIRKFREQGLKRPEV